MLFGIRFSENTSKNFREKGRGQMDWALQCIELIVKFIERVGFPVFVAVWVLIVQQKALSKLTGAINALTMAVNEGRLLNIFKKKGGD